MSDYSPSRPTADRNLLFGILALQLDFISRDAFIAAVRAWVLDKGKALGRLLQDQGQLTSERLVLLNALVAAHLRAHQNDPQHSLEAVAVPSSVRQQLDSLGDGDVQASLAAVGSLATTDPKATSPHAPRPEDNGPPRRYRIVRPHATGGLGQVHVAVDQELHREVALKDLLLQRANDLRSRQRFLLEAEITGRLEHPGIVPVYGLGQYADGRPFYVMRFIKGHDLTEAIHRFHQAENASRDPGERNLAWRRLLGRFVDVCNAVAYAHSKGVLHRDLKPGNIILGKYGETLVVDWGLAKALGRREGTTDGDQSTLRPSSGSGVEPTQIGSAIGTPAYMSPEQALGQLDELGPASDVYSLGATLYTLLTGRPPFESKEVRDVLRQVQEGQVVPPQQVKPAVPPALAAICLKAMARQPAARYAAALDLAADVEHWLAEEPVTAYAEPITPRAWRWTRQHQTLVGSGMAALVGGVVFLGGLVALVTYQNVELAQANAREREAREELAEKQEALRQTNDQDRRANAELDEKYQALEQANATERAAKEELARKQEALRQANDQERQANAKLDEKNRALQQANANERAAKEELARKNEALAQANDTERQANAELDKKNRTLQQANANERQARAELIRKNEALAQAHDKERRANTTERQAREELARKNEALAQAHDKERRANAELDEKNRALQQANAIERAAKLLAEKHFALANQIVEDSLTHVADDHRLQQADLLELRKKLLQSAVGFYTKLLEQREPSNPQMANLLRIGHAGRAWALQGLNRHREALPDWDRALERATGPERERYRVRRALCLAHLGEHAQAMGEASALAKTKEMTASYLYDLACVCALASAAADQDARLPQADRDKLGEEYAVRAVDLLKQAGEAGHFNTPAQRKHLEKDPNLDTLRTREDFNRWLDDLEKSEANYWLPCG